MTIRSATADDRDTILAIAAAVEMFDADEMVMVRDMLDSHLAAGEASTQH